MYICVCITFLEGRVDEAFTGDTPFDVIRTVTRRFTNRSMNEDLDDAAVLMIEDASVVSVIPSVVRLFEDDEGEIDWEDDGLWYALMHGRIP